MQRVNVRDKCGSVSEIVTLKSVTERVLFVVGVVELSNVSNACQSNFEACTYVLTPRHISTSTLRYEIFGFDLKTIVPINSDRKSSAKNNEIY